MQLILGLGSNIGDRLAFLHQGIDLISSVFSLKSISKIYETESMLKDGQQNYYNCAVLCETEVPPLDILDTIKKIEQKIGRIDTGRWKERVIDLDILDYHQQILNTDRLTLPHKGLHLRSFTLYPVADLIDNYIHPVYNLNTHEMISSLSDDYGIKVVRGNGCRS